MILSLIPLVLVIPATVNNVVPMRIVLPIASPSGNRFDTIVGQIIAILSRAI